MEEGRLPPVFHQLPSVKNAVQLNIYDIKPPPVEEGGSLVEAYVELLVKHMDLPADFWSEDEAQSWHRQSVLSLHLQAQHLRMTKNDMTVSDVPLADGSTGGKNCRLFVLSPLLEVDGMHGFLPDSNNKTRKTESSKSPASTKDIDAWLDEVMASSSEGEDDEEGGEGSDRKRARPAEKKKKINDNGTITVRSAINGRFPLLSPSIEQFNAFMLALDLVARQLLKQDRRMLPQLELCAVYHTHVQCQDAYTRGNRYRQSLEELNVEYRSAPLTECKINFKIKGNYIVRTNGSPEGGIFRAPRLDAIDHLPDAFNVDNFEPSSLEELVAAGNKCYVQFLFHPGQLYERYASGRSGDEVYRGITLRVYRIVFWPVSEHKLPPSLSRDGVRDLWTTSMGNSVAATTAFYAEATGQIYVDYDEFGLPVRSVTK